MLRINIETNWLEESLNPSLTQRRNMINYIQNIVRDEEYQLILIGQKQMKFSFQMKLCQNITVPLFCFLEINQTDIIAETSLNNYQIIKRIKKYGHINFLYFLNKWNTQSNGSKAVWKKISNIVSIIKLIPIYRKNFKNELSSTLKQMWGQFKNFLTNFIKATNYLFKYTPHKDCKFKNLNTLKSIFQQNRKKRKKSTAVSLLSEENKDQNYSLTIQDKTPINLEQTQNINNFILKINSLSLIYEDFSPILRYISIKEKSQHFFSLWKVKSGHNCLVKSYLFTYKNLTRKSINREVQKLVAQDQISTHCEQFKGEKQNRAGQSQENKKLKITSILQKQEQKHIKKQRKFQEDQEQFQLRKTVLVEKTALFYDEQPFKNQLHIIKLLRNGKCPYIASYYLSSRNNFDFNQAQSIYLDFYQQEFSNNESNSKKIHIINKLIEGINFLTTKRICHRDLKPKNIMLDHLRAPKIIDFGSSSPFYGDIRAKNKSYQLRTTIRYNKFYETSKPQIRKLYTQDQFERHQMYDIYAFGAIIQEMISNMDFQYQMGAFMRQNYDYIADRCTENNPEDRLTPKQIIIYIQELVKCRKMIDIANGQSS